MTSGTDNFILKEDPCYYCQSGFIKCKNCGAKTEEFEKIAQTTTGIIFYAVCRCGKVYHGDKYGRNV